MNRFYLLIPLVLLALFGAAYAQHRQQREAELVARSTAASAAKAAAQEQQADAERKAREAADQRSAARQREAQQKEEAERVRRESETAQIEADTQAHLGQARQLRVELAAVERQLAAARSANAAETAQVLALAREVELARIAKRNAELELQRTTAILARCAAQSGLGRDQR
jgi:glucose dehydrogenase